MRARRVVALAMVVLGAVPVAGPSARANACVPRMLVLSAFPGEIDRLLTEAALDPGATQVVDGRSFFFGTLRGNDVVLALSGIGLVNAASTTVSAIEAIRCGEDTAIAGIVFSGVSGGRTFIGDVTVPDRWTEDDGETWVPVDPEMFAVAAAVAASGDVDLARETPPGDVACAGIDPRPASVVTLDHEPRIIAGGDGKSADPFGGRPFPCIPGGGDVFGCEACRRPGVAAPDAVRFVTRALPFADPAFFLDFFESPPPPTSSYTAEDMESASVARVAASNGIPFIAFRALSDGLGDPLMLPGFPFQFFVYRQLAADNAAAVTLAFLEERAAAA